MSAEQRQMAADLWTKSEDLSRRSPVGTIANTIYYYSARKLILILPSHRG